MVSRETSVLAGVFALAVVAVWVTIALDVPLQSPLGVVTTVGFYVTVLGGTQLYLAWRGVEGSVTLGSRWRFLALLAWAASSRSWPTGYRSPRRFRRRSSPG